MISLHEAAEKGVWSSSKSVGYRLRWDGMDGRGAGGCEVFVAYVMLLYNELLRCCVSWSCLFCGMVGGGWLWIACISSRPSLIEGKMGGCLYFAKWPFFFSIRGLVL